MKKKILSLILVLMLLPIASLFSACKQDGYNLNNLQQDFSTIKNENENIKYVNGKYVFDYSNHANLNSVVEYTYPYTELNNYNYVYENLMAFTFKYIDECSDNSAVKSVEEKNAIKQDLDDFKDSLKKVNAYVNMLAEIINVSYNTDIFNPTCLSTYKNLLLSYEELFSTGANLNNSLADLYFNKVLKNGNPKVVDTSVENFDVGVVVNKFDARLQCQKSNLTQCFVEMYIDGGELADDLANSRTFFDLTTYNYEDNIDAISKSFNEQIAIEKASSSTTKQTYYNLSVEAYNQQVVLDNDQSKFNYACAEISYSTLNRDEATSEELMCYEIIKSRYGFLVGYNSTLAQMLDITGV